MCHAGRDVINVLRLDRALAAAAASIAAARLAFDEVRVGRESSFFLCSVSDRGPNIHIRGDGLSWMDQLCVPFPSDRPEVAGLATWSIPSSSVSYSDLSTSDSAVIVKVSFVHCTNPLQPRAFAVETIGRRCQFMDPVEERHGDDARQGMESERRRRQPGEQGTMEAMKRVPGRMEEAERGRNNDKTCR